MIKEMVSHGRRYGFELNPWTMGTALGWENEDLE